MRQLLHQVCYTRYHLSFYLRLIGSVLKHSEVPKYYDQDCSSFTNSASQRSFCHSEFSGSKIPPTPKSSISISPTNRNGFSFSIPSVIIFNHSKPACAPSQTIHLLPFPTKSRRRHFQSCTQACQSIFFFKIRRCLILSPYFKFLNYRSNVMQQQHYILL